MGDEWIARLAPIASSIISRLISGEKVKGSEQLFILLFSMAQDMKEMRASFASLNDTSHKLVEGITELRVEIALLRGRLEK